MRKSAVSVSGTYIRYLAAFVLFFILSEMLTLVLLAFLNRQSQKEQAIAYARNAAELTDKRLAELTERTDADLNAIISRNGELRVLSSPQKNARVLSACSLLASMNNYINSNTWCDAFTVASPAYKVGLIARSARISYPETENLTEFTWDLFDRGISDGSWHMEKIDQTWYLVRYYNLPSSIIAAYFSADTLARENPYAEMTDAGQRITLLWNGEKVFSIGQDTSTKTEITEQSHIKGLSILVGRTYTGLFFDGTLTPVIASVCMLTIIAMLFVMYYIRQELINPVTELINTANEIRRGNLERRAQLICSNKEMRNLGQATNEMIDTIVQQRIDTYEQIIARKEAELRYLQVQIRPHFFLGTLSSISSMTWNSNPEVIRAYIDHLSNNIRYLFAAGYHTVPLKEEVAHVREYLNCQEILYPECVFTAIEIPREIEGWQVPPLILHTFVENIYKHAVSFERPIALQIKGFAEANEDKSRELHLIVEDDGPGFPSDVMDAVNHFNGNIKNDGKRVGIMNIAHTLDLMYDNCRLLMLSNPESGGGRVHMIIPERPKVHMTDEVRPI